MEELTVKIMPLHISTAMTDTIKATTSKFAMMFCFLSSKPIVRYLFITYPADWSEFCIGRTFGLWREIQIKVYLVVIHYSLSVK